MSTAVHMSIHPCCHLLRNWKYFSLLALSNRSDEKCIVFWSSFKTDHKKHLKSTFCVYLLALKILSTENINLPNKKACTNASKVVKKTSKSCTITLSDAHSVYCACLFSPRELLSAKKKKDWRAFLIPSRYELYTRIWLLLIIIKKCLFCNNKDLGWKSWPKGGWGWAEGTCSIVMEESFLCLAKHFLALLKNRGGRCKIQLSQQIEGDRKGY